MVRLAADAAGREKARPVETGIESGGGITERMNGALDSPLTIGLATFPRVFLPGIAQAVVKLDRDRYKMLFCHAQNIHRPRRGARKSNYELELRGIP